MNANQRADRIQAVDHLLAGSISEEEGNSLQRERVAIRRTQWMRLEMSRIRPGSRSK